MEKINITVSGPAKSGKSTILRLIINDLKHRGFEVEYNKEEVFDDTDDLNATELAQRVSAISPRICVQLHQQHVNRSGTSAVNVDPTFERRLRSLEDRVSALQGTRPLMNQKIPVPSGIYFAVGNDNFYDIETNQGMGLPFFAQWSSRWKEFPQESMRKL